MADEKIGAGHAKAWIRQGGKEAAQALQAFPDGIKLVEEPGLVGNLTPQEVVEEKGKAPHPEWMGKEAQAAMRNAPELDEMEWER